MSTCDLSSTSAVISKAVSNLSAKTTTISDPTFARLDPTNWKSASGLSARFSNSINRGGDARLIADGRELIDSSTPAATVAIVSANKANLRAYADNRSSIVDNSVPSQLMSTADSSNIDRGRSCTRLDNRKSRLINELSVGEVSYDLDRFGASNHTRDAREELASRTRDQQNKMLEVMSATVTQVAMSQDALWKEVREKTDDSLEIVVDLKGEFRKWQEDAEIRKQEELKETRAMWSNVHRIQESCNAADKNAQERAAEDLRDKKAVWESMQQWQENFEKSHAQAERRLDDRLVSQHEENMQLKQIAQRSSSSATEAVLQLKQQFEVSRRETEQVNREFAARMNATVREVIENALSNTARGISGPPTRPLEISDPTYPSAGPRCKEKLCDNRSVTDDKENTRRDKESESRERPTGVSRDKLPAR
jgi:hypothetical protein